MERRYHGEKRHGMGCDASTFALPEGRTSYAVPSPGDVSAYGKLNLGGESFLRHASFSDFFAYPRRMKVLYIKRKYVLIVPSRPYTTYSVYDSLPEAMNDARAILREYRLAQATWQLNL